MPSVYVTGIAGFLGSHVAEALMYECAVRGCDNLSGGDPRNVPSGLPWREADCCDTSVMREELGHTEILYHCAALPHEGLSVFSPSAITRSIFEASVSVFSAAAAAGVRRVVYCSSMSRYGANPSPFTEAMDPAPQDPYAIAKVAAEQVLAVLAKVHGFEYVIAVPHNIVGPRQKYDDPFRNVAAIMANRMLQGLDPIVYGDGLQTRCFSDVRDAVKCLVAMGFREGLNGEVINIGPDEEFVPIRHLRELLAEITGFEGGTIWLPDRPQEVKDATCSSAKARHLLDYRTEHRLYDTLETLVEHIVERGTKPFTWHLPVEIVTNATPKWWLQEVM